MAEESVDGAIAAATYYVQLMQYAQATGDLEEWAALSGPECVFCARVHDLVADRNARGVYASGGEVHADLVRSGLDYDLNSGAAVYYVDLALEIDDLTQHHPDGTTTLEEAWGHTFRLFLTRTELGWLVVDVLREAED
ncbi:DUF6318 family protein [Ruania halotolerans]|uniref:DUF6318 family protein n=1 Tax=Ruania halotolerans TaxID=2897773 RepID=UPI001E29F5F7|nr:DUF6318 family protein [Ruania halotolerans]UFU08017.1 DUF6318 family protein [Ruania halotolerans]